MNDRQSIEITGDSIDDAVQKGLAALGASPFDVIVEVLEEPSRGVFGIGARPAKVRLQRLRPATPPRPEPPAPTQAAPSAPHRSEPPPSTRSSAPAKPQSEKSSKPGGGRPGQNRPQRPRHDRRRERDHEDEEEFSEENDLIAFENAVPEAEITEDGQVAREVLSELLQNMGVRAQVIVSRSESSRPGEASHWLLNVAGSKVDQLIGRRGETISSLQYVTRLIVSRRLQRRANVVVDVGGYKSRRSQKLRELAGRMADQAVSQGRTVVMEPMPPHERRMIHMALRSRPDVTTKSTGEGDSRKVTIIPKTT